MSALPVARTEFRRHIRGKTPWIIGILFVLVSRVPTSPKPPVVQALGPAVSLVHAQTAVAIVVPITVAALGYRAIIGERESGTIRILAGTTVSRTDLVLGKSLAYTAALAVPLLVGTLLVVGFDASQYGVLSASLLAGFLVLTLGYILVCVTIVVALSTIVSSTTRAAVAVFVFAILGAVFWSDITAPVLWQLGTGAPPGNTMHHAQRFTFVKRLSVTGSYYVLTNWLFGAPIGAGSAALQVSDALAQPSGTATAYPVYLAPWIALLQLFAWPAVTLLVGLVTFRRGDLALPTRSGRIQTVWRRVRVVPYIGVKPFSSIGGRDGPLDALPGAWQAVARREFRRLTRSSGVWIVGGLIFVAAALSLSPRPLVRDALGSAMPLAALQNPIRLFAGTGILFGTFRAIISERDSGRIRLTAGTAAARTDVLVGFLVGRVSAYAVPVVLASVVVCALAIPRYGLVPIGALLGFLAVTVVYLGAMAGLGIGISVLSTRQSIAGCLVLGLMALTLVWDTLLNALYGAVTGMTVSGFDPPADPVYILLEWASPISLFSVVTNPLLGVSNSSGIASTVIVDLQPNVFTNIIVLRTLFGVDVPVWYLHPAIGLVGLLLWFGIPFGAAIMRFRVGDIG